FTAGQFTAARISAICERFANPCLDRAYAGDRFQATKAAALAGRAAVQDVGVPKFPSAVAVSLKDLSSNNDPGANALSVLRIDHVVGHLAGAQNSLCSRLGAGI